MDCHSALKHLPCGEVPHQLPLWVCPLLLISDTSREVLQVLAHAEALQWTLGAGLQGFAAGLLL